VLSVYIVLYFSSVRLLVMALLTAEKSGISVKWLHLCKLVDSVKSAEVFGDVLSVLENVYKLLLLLLLVLVYIHTLILA